MKNVTALLVFFLYFGVLPAFLIGQNIPENDLGFLVGVSTNDSGLKQYFGLQDHFVQDQPLDDAISPVSPCGVISLVNNFLIVNSGDWDLYDEFKIRVSVVDQVTTQDLWMFDDLSTTYKTYLDYDLQYMSYCMTPISCGYTPNYFLINNSISEFGFYDATSNEMATCAAAAVWDVTVGNPNLIYNSASLNPPFYGNSTTPITSISGSMQGYYMSARNYCYVLATDPNPLMNVRMEVFGRISTATNPVWVSLATEMHPNTVVLDSPPPASFGINATVIGTPPPFASINTCLNSFKKAQQDNNVLSVSLSPNPVQDRLNIAIEDHELDAAYSITVFDIQGNEVLHDDALGNGGYIEKTISTEVLAKGFYMVKVMRPNGAQIKKFTKI